MYVVIVLGYCKNIHHTRCCSVQRLAVILDERHLLTVFLFGLKQDDDTVALVRRTSDLELGVQAGGLGSLPPQWWVYFPFI